MANAPRPAPQPVLEGPLPSCRGFQQIVAATLASVTTLTVPAGSTMVLLQAEAGDLRWRADEQDPTTTVGMLIAEGGEVLYAASEDALAKIRFIRGTAGAILNCSYY